MVYRVDLNSFQTWYLKIRGHDSIKDSNYGFKLLTIVNFFAVVPIGWVSSPNFWPNLRMVKHLIDRRWRTHLRETPQEASYLVNLHLLSKKK